MMGGRVGVGKPSGSEDQKAQKRRSDGGVGKRNIQGRSGDRKAGSINGRYVERGL